MQAVVLSTDNGLVFQWTSQSKLSSTEEKRAEIVDPHFWEKSFRRLSDCLPQPFEALSLELTEIFEDSH